MAAKSTNAQAKKAEYDRVRAKPLTRIHGRPGRGDYDRMVQELSDTAISVNIPAYAWSMDAATGTDYGALPIVIGGAAYLNKTGLIYVEPGRPPAFDPRIHQGTTAYNKTKWAAEHEEKKECYAILDGAKEAMADNIRDALDSMYYEQLRQETLGYTTVTVREYLTHLTDKWCRINMATRKKMKNHLYRGWQEDEHVTAFAARLKKERTELASNGITIEDDDLVEHYVLEMYKRELFDRVEMTVYENKADADKTFDLTCAYFAELVAEREDFEFNSGGAERKARFESAAAVQEADVEMGNEIRAYMEALASTQEEEREERKNLQSNNESMLAMQSSLQSQLAEKDVQIELVGQIAKLTASVVTLTESFKGGDQNGGRKRARGPRSQDKENNNPQTGTNTAAGTKKAACKDTRPPWLLKISNMGGYCWTCGYNPVGLGHTSATCKNKAPGHYVCATATDRKGGSEANKPE